MSDYRGYSIPGEGSIHVGRLPERKSPAVYVVRNGEIQAIAYMHHPNDAPEFVAMLDQLALSYNHKPDDEDS